MSHKKLGRIYDDIEQDPAFENLRVGKAKLVQGEGDNPIAMLIGEAPGAQEAMHGRPFVGASGIMLRRFMYLVGLNSADPGAVLNCWITNVVKYRPLRNRTPSLKEVEASRWYLRREWRAIGRPKLIVPIGATALSAVVGRPASVTHHAGKPFTRTVRFTETDVVVFPMLHPAFGLRNEGARPIMQEHWEKLGEWIDSNLRSDSGARS